MKKLVHNVLWPAVAGNVLWALLQLAVGDDKPQALPVLAPRLLALLFIGVYLSRDWIDTEQANLKDTYWLADLPMGAAIAVFAIAIQASIWWSWIPLIAAFVIAIIGHLRGAWDEIDKTSQWPGRWAFAATNFLGVVIVGMGALYDRTQVWTQALAILVVIILFLTLRNYFLEK